MSEHEEKLVAFLSRIQITRTFDGRGDLLRDVTGRAGLERDEGNQLRDLRLIVKQLRTDRDGLRRLAENLRPYLLDDEVTAVEQLIEAVRTLPRVPALELGTLHRFDLQPVIDACMPRIRRRRGLIGFSLTSPSERLVDCLIERVKDEMSTFGVPLTRKISTMSGLRSVRSAVERLRSFLSATKAHDVVCGAVVGDGAAAAALWEGAAKELEGCANRFVLFVLSPESFAAPAGTFPLNSPVFQLTHAVGWWREVLQSRKWRADRLPDILGGFVQPDAESEDERLDMDFVYDDLTDAMELLRRHPEEDDFCAAWARRLQGAT